jgi:hypothetical protein
VDLVEFDPSVDGASTEQFVAHVNEVAEGGVRSI